MKPAVSETDLNTYLDGQLPPGEAAGLEARLAEDTEASSRLDAMTEQKKMLRAALMAVPAGEGSPRTLDLEQRLAGRLRQRERVSAGTWAAGNWLRKAAAAVVLVAAGWGGHMTYADLSHPLPEYVAEAAGAHLVFADSAHRPMDVDPTQPLEMASWLSSRLGKSITVPSLEPLNISFISARLLGTKEGPLAQVVYEDQDSHRMTLSIAPHRYQGNTGIIHAEHGGINLAYWSDAELSYVLAAKTTAAQIEVIAAEIVNAGQAAAQ
jgi:anti-sigma factor RsiW